MYIRRKYPMLLDAVTVPPQRYQLPLQIFLLLMGDALATGAVVEEQSPYYSFLPDFREEWNPANCSDHSRKFILCVEAIRVA
jgi:hypothetical protein